MGRPTERTEPITNGSPLDRLAKQHRAERAIINVRELASDLEFAIDVSEPRETIIARFEEFIEKAIQAQGAAPHRCKCGVLATVSHYCSVLGHAWIGQRLPTKGCIYHTDDPYPAGCPDCADIAQRRK